MSGSAEPYDVFLCYNSQDKAVVREIGRSLRAHGLNPWLDEWELRPGLLWQEVLEKEIPHIRSATIFVGAEGIGPWQNHEVAAFLRQFAERGCPVIPVILPGCKGSPKLPVFLKDLTWVDFRSIDEECDLDPLGQLIWGITGRRPYETSRAASGAENSVSLKKDYRQRFRVRSSFPFMAAILLAVFCVYLVVDNMRSSPSGPLEIAIADSEQPNRGLFSENEPSQHSEEDERANAIDTVQGQRAISGGKYALIVGNNAYPKVQLINAVHDAHDMSEALREVGFEVTAVQDNSGLSWRPPRTVA